MKITRYIHNIDFSSSERDIKNYVFTILSNEITNILMNCEEIDGLDEEFSEQIEYSFIEELDIKEKYSEIVKIIESLDEKYSTALYLFYCKEMTVNEISELMGITPKTIYTRLSRGKKLMLDAIKGAKVDG